ncbi:sensor histidine kinase [Nonomuraea terrae]|uniref:histidine kinase n=1 Tax=Nonomuraea terrae TaxID=2530383 RepID=A0A4R4Z091_9ACTN|nr:histidine kinase [Nonomuraea terrae]TDD51213.1 sensor histidine kinase [Nonomuraea terrae]
MSELRVLARLRRWANALPPIGVDSALAAAALVAQLWPLLFRDNPYGGPWDWWGYASVIAATVPLAWRRRAPAVVLIVSLVLGESYDLVDEVAAQPIWYGGLVALYTVAAYSGRVTRVAMFTVTIGGGLLMVGSWETAMRGIVLFVAAYAIGRAAAASRARAAVLEERAAQLAREREIEAERAAERERARIARDMHDILAHAVSVMVVQAEAGPLAVEGDPARAVAAFDAIAAAGRDAMEQLRRMLNVLKEGEGPRAPQPTIAALPGLADQVRATGLEVTYSTAGEPRPMSPDAEVAAYRITQEALTNVVKHAGGARAGIALTWQERELMIDITDDGRGRDPGLPSGGNGLIGIRERAAACGGSAQAGPRADGRGFRVSVRLPVQGVTA